MANYLPINERSGRLLKRLGFKVEGYARDYIFINGAWQDHILTAMLNPLPAIALLPMAMLWFGLGTEAIVFTLLHSVIWPVALNMHTGFLGVSDTQRMVVVGTT